MTHPPQHQQQQKLMQTATYEPRIYEDKGKVKSHHIYTRHFCAPFFFLLLSLFWFNRKVDFFCRPPSPPPPATPSIIIVIIVDHSHPTTRINKTSFSIFFANFFLLINYYLFKFITNKLKKN